MGTANFQSIVITGASSGLGAELARQFSLPGVSLALIGRNENKLKKVEDSCKLLGANVNTAIIDVRNAETLGKWLLEYDELHPVDLVIANAGVTYSFTDSSTHEPLNVIIDIIDTNFIGVINTVNPLISLLEERKRGHIAIISSLSAYRGVPTFPAYSASKTAIKCYFEAIRGRLKRHNINTTIVCPGYIKTPMTQQLKGIKLMIMNVEHAARKIKKGIEQSRLTIIFPLSLAMAIWVTNILPARINDWIYSLLFLKNRK